MLFAPKSWLLILAGAALYAYLSKPRMYPSNQGPTGPRNADQIRLRMNQTG